MLSLKSDNAMEHIMVRGNLGKYGVAYLQIDGSIQYYTISLMLKERTHTITLH